MKSGSDLFSCLINHFKDMGYFSGTTIVELTICDDNCVVKNRNKITICYILWILETGVFPLVTLLFFIRGHINNTIDNLLNLLKGGYHKRYIFTCK